MPEHDTHQSRGPVIGFVPIDEAYRSPDSVVAAMMSAAQEAAARVAEGATWEGDEEILIPPAARPHCLKMAAIWRYAADHLQSSGGRFTRGDEPTPVEGAPDRSAPAGSRAC